MSYFGVYIPPSKSGFEGTTAQCAGSIAAVNIKPVLESSSSPGASEEHSAIQYEDPDYPPDSPLWLIFTDKSKALDVLRHYKEARLREFPNREQAESYVQFGFESIKSLKRFGKAKPSMSKPIQLAASLAVNFKAATSSAAGQSSDSPYSSPPTGSASSSPLAVLNLLSSSPTSNGSSSSMLASLITSSSNVVVLGNSSQQQSTLGSERPPFRAPSKQELVDFRKQIEAGNDERVKRIVWENPRFLISSGDTPTSLKDGYRYNAMHICAQSNQARVAELLLKTISDREYTQLYAGKRGSGEMCAALNENLLDYYLNIPDKGRGETPLHFAVKNGHVAVVQVLTSYPQCKSLPNKEGQHPRDIICLRAPHTFPSVVKKIELLLTNPYYVPVLRASENQLPPRVGQPFTPNDPPNLLQRNDECERLSVDLSISALAGPMPRDQAQSFYRRWKTPPRIGSNVMSPLASSPYISPMKTPAKSIFNQSGGSSPLASSSPTGRRMLFSPLAATPPPAKAIDDQQNGNHKKQEEEEEEEDELINGDSENEEIENNNNNQQLPQQLSYLKATLKHTLDLPATPIRQLKPDLFGTYRNDVCASPFADDYSASNISLDFSLNVSVSTLNDSFRERHIKNSDIGKGLEVVGRQLARQEQLEWREFWDFLDAFVDIAAPEGVARLESYLAEKSDQVWNFAQMHHYLDVVADRGRALSSATAGSVVSGEAITQVTTPYTCVEKSLQVFAKRITKTLINNIGHLVSINDTLLSELKRLKSLIVSFKDDPRFISVDFGKVHSRIAHLVASYIAHSQEMSVAMCLQLLAMLRDLLQLQGEQRREHLDCVCSSMLLMLEQPSANPAHLPDALKTEQLCSAAWQAEQLCGCQWDANLSRKTSRRKRTESMRSQLVANTPNSSNSANSVNSASSPSVVVAAQLTAAAKAASAWRTNNNNSDDEDDDKSDGEEQCYFDCSIGGESSDDEDVFLTPPESVSPILTCHDEVEPEPEPEPSYELFIFGKEPTKRDLDVLNAIFHVDIEKERYPHVHAWKTAMESFSTAEMDLFPSPKHVQKTHKPIFAQGTPKTLGSANSSTVSVAGSVDSASLVLPKRLLATPKLSSIAPRWSAAAAGSPPPVPPKPMRLPRTPLPNGLDFAAVAATAAASSAAAPPPPSFQTPLSKVRGLFSKFREPRVDDRSMGSFNGNNTALSLDESD